MTFFWMEGVCFTILLGILALFLYRNASNLTKYQQRILEELRSLKEITRIQNSAKNARWPHEATRCMAGTINATIGVTQAKFGHSIWGCEMHMVFQILKYKNDCMLYLGAELALMKVCLL